MTATTDEGEFPKIGKYKLQEEKRKLEMQIKALNEVNQDKN